MTKINLTVNFNRPKALTKDAGWDESKHKRNHGQFASTGGSQGERARARKEAEAKKARDHASDYADEHKKMAAMHLRHAKAGRAPEKNTAAADAHKAAAKAYQRAVALYDRGDHAAGATAAAEALQHSAAAGKATEGLTARPFAGTK